MKIMASADHHFDHTSRFAECLRIHDSIAEQVEREKPDVFLSAGDIYDRASVPVEREAVAERLVRIAETCPVLIARGNHDALIDLQILGRLRSKHPIVVEETAGFHDLGAVRVAAVAWPNRASIAAMVGHTVPQDAIDDVARDALRSVFLGLSKWQPHVLLGHFMIDGSKVSRGQPLIGAELNIGLSDLALARAKMVIAGHIHCPQDWTFGEMPIVYCGSPYRTEFGETEEKSILIADVTDKGCEWSRIATPATPMLLLEFDYVPGVEPATSSWQGSPVGAEIRLRYTVDTDQREAAKAAADAIAGHLKSAGAISVKVEEEVRATTRARVPEISTAVSLPDQIRAFWRSKALDVSEERDRSVMGKLDEIKEEVAA